MFKTLWSAFLLLFAFSLAATRADDEGARLAALRGQVVAAVARFKLDQSGSAPEPEVRHLADAANSILALGDDAKTAESYLRLALSTQNMDEHSPDFGKVPWQIGHPNIADLNSIEFTMLTLGAAVLRYGNQLSDSFRQELPPHIKAAITAIRRHDVKVSYSNIYLMKIANLMMLGQIAGDPSAVADGKANLDAWLDFTRTNGVTEYDSPTYSGVQLDCLDTVYLQAPDPATKAKAREALDYLWSGLAANFFPGREDLRGPLSRCYSFLFHTGSLQHHYYLEGLAPTLTGTEALGGLWLNAMRPGDYHPSAAILAPARIPERVILQRFGSEEGQVRFSYMTPDFVIGSASAYYGPQDVQVSADFATKKNLPVTSVVLDTYDAPYGMVTDTDKSGHVKPHHLKDLVAAVQDKGTLLALYDLAFDSQLAGKEQKSVATNIVLPAHVDAFCVNGAKVDSAKPFKIPAGADATVCLREGNAALAARIFAADGCAGHPAGFEIEYDGNEWGAARLVAYHYREKPARLKDHPIRAGLFLHMERCAGDQEFADFMKRMQVLKVTQQESNGEWSASLEIGGTRLAAGLNPEKKKITLREINASPPQVGTLSVNGRDLTAEFLAPIRQ